MASRARDCWGGCAGPLARGRVASVVSEPAGCPGFLSAVS